MNGYFDKLEILIFIIDIADAISYLFDEHITVDKRKTRGKVLTTVMQFDKPRSIRIKRVE